jgi:Lsr2
MSEMQDIRVWAREHGYQVADRGRLPGEVVEAYGTRNEDDGSGDEPMLMQPATGNGSAAEPVPGPVERPPVEPPRPRAGLFARKPQPPGKPKGAPRPRHNRVSIENILSTGWGIGAMALARRPEAIPVARVMDMQAPVAGLIGEELLKGTLLDRLLQPLARGGAKAEMAVALIGPPLIVGIMTAQPGTFPVLRPMLKMSMMTWMEVAEPQMRKVQKRAETWSEKFGDVDLDAMIDALWAGLPEAGPESPHEEENIRKAKGDD